MDIVQYVKYMIKFMMLKLAGNSQRAIKKADDSVLSGVVQDPKIDSGILYLSTKNDLDALVYAHRFFKFPAA